MKDAFIEFFKKHPGKIVGVFVGLVLTLLFFIIGFFGTILLIILSTLGYFLGSWFDGGFDIVGFIERIIKPSRFK